MKYCRSISILIFSTFIACNSLAQGKLLYMNGKEKRFTTAEVRGDQIVYRPEGASGEVTRHAEIYNIFSIIRDNGTEEIIYTPDTITGDDPPAEEVRDYIMGEQHAMAVYKKPLNTVGGVASGVAGSIVGFYGLPVPLVYATIVGRFNPKLPKSERSNVHSEAFLAGYEKKSRNIKIKQSMIGGGIGFAVGITALILILGND
jgi:hypothetical protein